MERRQAQQPREGADFEDTTMPLSKTTTKTPITISDESMARFPVGCQVVRSAKSLSDWTDNPMSAVCPTPASGGTVIGYHAGTDPYETVEHLVIADDPEGCYGSSMIRVEDAEVTT